VDVADERIGSVGPRRASIGLLQPGEERIE
jgi:hypothetical protein